MAIKPLNSIDGFSVGSNSNVVVYANLDIVGNTITADNNLIGNGLIVNGISNLSTISNVKIFGGTSGQTIITDGLGNLTFSSIGSGNSAAPMPYYVPDGQTSTVPLNYQGLFFEPIEIDGTFDVEGILIDVSGGGSGGGNANINAVNNQVLFALDGNATGNTGFTFDSTTGNFSVSGNAIVGNISLSTSLQSNRANVSVTTNTIIDQFVPANFRTAKYIISASSDDGFQSVESLLVHDGTNSYITIYGSICSNVSADIIDLSSNINGVSGNVALYATSAGANCKVNMIVTYLNT